MKKKILFIILMIFICAGCKARYTVTINKDGTVEENLSASETPDFYDQYTHSSVGRIVSQIQSRYIDDLNAKKYSVRNFIYVNSDSGSTVSKKYSNFKEYIGNSIIYSQFTDKIDYKEENDKVTISLKGQFSHKEQNQEFIPVDYGVISITVPYKVLENNADEVKGNTYVWNFDEKSETRELKLVYTKSKIQNMDFNYNGILIVLILVILAIVSVVVCKKFKTSRNEANKI